MRLAKIKITLVNAVGENPYSQLVTIYYPVTEEPIEEPVEVPIEEPEEPVVIEEDPPTEIPDETAQPTKSDSGSD